MANEFLFKVVVTGISLALVQFSFAQVGDKAAPPRAEQIVEISLENPVNSKSKTYLDLDTGKIFSYGDSTPESYLESRRWIGTSGTDLMCETRMPAEGLVAYDMVLIPTPAGIDRPREYAELKRLLEESKPESFQMLSIAAATPPKTYVFRTREGALGVLEIIAPTESPSGMRLRYCLVQKPVQNTTELEIAMQRRAQAMALALQRRAPQTAQDQRRNELESQLNLAQQQLQELQRTHRDDESVVINTRRRQELFEEELNINASETDLVLVDLKFREAKARFDLDIATRKKPPGDPALGAMEEQINELQRQIYLAEATHARKPVATQALSSDDRL